MSVHNSSSATVVKGPWQAPEHKEVKEVKAEKLPRKDSIESVGSDEEGCCSSCSSCFSGFASTLLAILISPYTFIAWCIKCLFCKEIPDINVACEHATSASVNQLLKDGADINEVMHTLLYYQHYDLMLQLLDQGASIDSLDKNGYGLLHRFCYDRLQNAQLDGKLLMNILLERGADINIQDSAGNTPLHIACRENAIRAVGYLVNYSRKLPSERQIDTESRNNRHETPLHIAAKTGSAGLVAILCNQMHANVNALDENRRTPLHRLCATKFDLDASHMVINNLDLKGELNVKIQDRWGFTPLHLAGLRGRVRYVDLLLERGADINAKGFKGRTLLHYAAMNADVAMINKLKEVGANFNLCDDDNETALSILTRPNDLELDVLYNTGKLLISLGASRNSPVDGKEFPEMDLFDATPQQIADAMRENAGDSERAKTRFSTSKAASDGDTRRDFTKTLKRDNLDEDETDFDMG